MSGTEEIMIVTFGLVCMLSVMANISLLAITIKVYSEVLKIQHIKAIGK